MKRVLESTATIFGLVFLFAMFLITMHRLFLNDKYDPLVPIAIILLISIGSAIYSVCERILNEMAEIKLASLMFLQQAREQTAFLQALSEATDLAERAEKIAENYRQNPDLN